MVQLSALVFYAWSISKHMSRHFIRIYKEVTYVSRDCLKVLLDLILIIIYWIYLKLLNCQSYLHRISVGKFSFSDDNHHGEAQTRDHVCNEHRSWSSEHVMSVFYIETLFLYWRSTSTNFKSSSKSVQSVLSAMNWKMNIIGQKNRIISTPVLGGFSPNILSPPPPYNKTFGRDSLKTFLTPFVVFSFDSVFI